jgi:hypothetical protein
MRWICLVLALAACKSAESKHKDRPKGPAPVAIEPITTPEQRCIATHLRVQECKADVLAEIERRMRAQGGGDSEVATSKSLFEQGLAVPVSSVCDPKQLKDSDVETMKTCGAEPDCAGFARCVVAHAK